MNKQEVIEKIRNISTLKINDTVSHQQIDMVVKNQVLDIISQIQEPKKVVVPQFVADFYEAIKNDFENKIYGLCADFYLKNLDEKIYDWFEDPKNNNKPIETLVMMHKFGYEVEEEKKYRVILKGNSESPDYLVDTVTDGFRFYSNIYTDKREHTRKELEEAGFGWVFDCEGIEIEEVEK